MLLSYLHIGDTGCESAGSFFMMECGLDPRGPYPKSRIHIYVLEKSNRAVGPEDLQMASTWLD